MTTTISPPIQSIRELRMKSNLNGKLHGRFMCHIQIGGKTGIPESVAENTLVKILTDDKSVDPSYWKIIDSIRVPLEEISSSLTWLSHAMSREEFIVRVLTEVPGSSKQTEMVVFFYEEQSSQID